MAPTTRSRSHHSAPLAIIHPHAAGLDIGADEIMVAVPPESDAQPVRMFGTFTVDLYRLADWLMQCGVDTVALESTGIYWIPLFEVLEARGIEVQVVNARHVKTVPGRKSDWNDAQWLQQLHALGLLRGSFRPDAEMRVLRTYLRHRAELIQHRAPHILHMQKALLQMNLHLTQVLTDITGVTGLAIIRAIVAGERDPVVLAQLRYGGCKSSEDQIAKALTGTWQAEHLFVLQQSLALFDYYTELLGACDAEIEQQFAAMKPRFESADEAPVLAARKPGSKSKNQPNFNARAQLARVVGIDLTGVMGLSSSLVLTIVSEIGTDMTKWPTVKHFCAWLGLAPRNDISGGKVLRSRTLKNRNRATQAFRQAAQSVARSDSAFGAYFRRMRAKHGVAQATVATAHKIARVVYHLLKEHEAFVEMSASEYDERCRERELKYLTRKAAKLGFTLAPNVPLPPGS
ncbi:MAG: IS110 family transposase [Chloroflexota bacterium]|nr:IS110 family transposase [Chloroflexota bacterium]